MTSTIIVTADPAVTVAQAIADVTAVVPVATTNISPKTGISISTPLSANIDFNTIVNAGFYYTVDINSLNAPVSGQFWYLHVDIDGANPTTFCIQTATELTGSNPIRYFRTQVGAVWGAWLQDVALNPAGQLPAVDGSQLTNIKAQQVNCGRLVFGSPTTVVFQPYKGNQIQINGVVVAIPSGGATLTNTGLTGSTLYYVYAFILNNQLTLTASLNGHATSVTAGNVGTEVMSGGGADAYSLVGMVYTLPNGQFQSSPTSRLVSSWFNRYPLALSNYAFGINLLIGGVGIFEVTPAYRVQFLTWADQISFLDYQLAYYSQTASGAQDLAGWLDGSALNITAINGDGSGRVLPIGLSYAQQLGEGQHVASVAGFTSVPNFFLYSISIAITVT